MTRLGHDFLIRKHTFTEAPASAVDAVWFADRADPPAFDPNLTKGSVMRYVLKLAFEFLVLMLKMTAYSFGLLFLVLGELSANSRSSESEEYFSNGGLDDGFDQFGSPMTPGEEACTLVSRKHYL